MALYLYVFVEVVHVYSPTPVHRHTLDLLITRDDQSVAVLPVNPPLLSDHAFVVADCSCPLPPSTTSTVCRQVRNWRGIDDNAFDADLQQSELFRAPPLDPEIASAVMTKLCGTCWTNMHHSSPSECL